MQKQFSNKRLKLNFNNNSNDNGIKNNEVFNNSFKSFVCINCENDVDELYKKVGQSVIKIQNCEKCSNLVDKYVEFEPMIILIDSILLSKSVYRHILYNRDFKLHWKLSLVLLLIESFALWRQKLDQPIISNIKINYSGEKGFYICCLQNIIDNLILFTMLYILFTIFNLFKVNINLNSKRISAVNFLKAIIIANFSKFLLLPIMIWKDNSTDLEITLYYLMLMGYYLISLTQVCSVISNLSQIRAGILVSTAFIIKGHLLNRYFSHFYENYLN